MIIRKVSVSFFLITLFACATPPTPPPPEPTMEAGQVTAAPPVIYLPAVIMSAPLVVDQRAGPEMCMAWSGKFLAEAQADFGWQFYYHSSTWRRPGDGAIPVVRAMPADRALFARQLLELRAADYDGLVLLANEPDMADQDDTPPDVLVGLYWYAQRVLPDATFIVPNAIDRAYLDQFLSLTRIRTKDVIGVHIYQGGPDTAGPHTWPAVWLDEVEAILARHDVHNPYWVSEVGPPETWRPDDLARYYDELFTSRAEVVCVYTTNCGGWLPGCGRDLYDGDGRLTTSGLALKSVVSPPASAGDLADGLKR
ncbi:MAG: hypothetical protein KBE23_03235 [Chloroflexi bacterium]|nr:hypothetical protein [Chloroflexota bacterium]MBP7041727.1 hypothetical protein [Chloroflexota bacterium]